MMPIEMPKTFSELQEIIYSEKYSIMELLCENLEDLTPFQLGRYQGELQAYQEVLNLLRKSIKYRDVE